jgi:hypothetical protein
MQKRPEIDPEIVLNGSFWPPKGPFKLNGISKKFLDFSLKGVS